MSELIEGEIVDNVSNNEAGTYPDRFSLALFLSNFIRLWKFSFPAQFDWFLRWLRISGS